MARKRMLDPSFWSDEKLGECNHLERLLFIGLISNADDEGRGRGNPKLLKSLIFPYDDLRVSDFEKSLSKVESLKLILLYQDGGQTYYCIPNFKKYQTINRSTPSELPGPPEECKTELQDDSVNAHGVLRESSVNAHGVLTPKRKEEKRSKEKGKEDSMPGAETAPAQPAVITLPLNTKEEHPITTKQVEEWKVLYPAVDVEQQLRNMRGWLDGNPKKRKTKDGILRFVTTWLKKEQDKGSPPPSAQKAWDGVPRL